MGFELSWIAFVVEREDEMLAKLGITASGDGLEPFAPLFLFRSAFWSIILEECSPPVLLDSLAIQALSKDCTIITCSLDEHTSKSRSAMLDHGTLRWQRVYDSELTMHNIDDYASVPTSDFQDPLAMAQSVTGFRYDLSGQRPAAELFLLQT